MNAIKHLFLFAVTIFGLSPAAVGQTTGEYQTTTEGTPAIAGQASHDHLFTRCEYNGQSYTNMVSFQDGATQAVWIHLDDDAIYLNERVQALTPIAYNAAGDLYNEITYNSFQCDIYLPENIEIIMVTDEDYNEIYYLQGDRLPSTSNINWRENGTKVIDGQTYRSYTVTCHNTYSYGTHFSARNGVLYQRNGALKKDATLFALYLRNSNQDIAEGRMDQDMIIANQLFTMRETYIAKWSANDGMFFYGSGGNNVTPRFMTYNRVELYGSSGFDPESQQDYLSAPDTAVMHGETIVLPISLNNAEAITAFQTDIYLPQGFEILKQDGDYLVDLSSRKARDHVIMANGADDGAVKVLSFSPGLKPYSGNDGELFYITVQVPDNGDGTYPIQLKNTRLTTTDGEEISIPDATCHVTVYPYIMGDVNNSGTVTITDAVITARYVLNYNPTPFVIGAADLNGDGIITVTDVVMIARLVLTATVNTPLNQPAPQANHDYMSGEYVGQGDAQQKTVAIELTNDAAYTAFQLDLLLPASAKASNFALSSRASGLSLDVNQLDNGKWRIIGYSTSLRPIDGTKGAILTFDVDNDGTIFVENIEMVTPQCQSIYPNDFIIGNQTIDVNEIASQTHVYSQGRDIIIDSPDEQTIIISDVMGHYSKSLVMAGKTIIAADRPGVYIISVAGQTFKLMLK